MRIVAIAYLLCFIDCAGPRYLVRRDSSSNAPAERLSGEEDHFRYQLFFANSYILLSVINDGPSALRFQPGLATVTSTKCEVRFQVSYVEGTGVKTFDDLEKQLTERWQKKRDSLIFSMDDSIDTDLGDRATMLRVDPGNFIRVIYRLRNLPDGCSPLAFRLSGNLSISATFTTVK